MYMVRQWTLEGVYPPKFREDIVFTYAKAYDIAKSRMENGGYKKIEIFEYDPETKEESLFPDDRFILTINGWKRD